MDQYRQRYEFAELFDDPEQDDNGEEVYAIRTTASSSTMRLRNNLLPTFRFNFGNKNTTHTSSTSRTTGSSSAGVELTTSGSGNETPTAATRSDSEFVFRRPLPPSAVNTTSSAHKRNTFCRSASSVSSNAGRHGTGTSSSSTTQRRNTHSASNSSSRLKTGTSSSTANQPTKSVIVAIVEGRGTARGEVGLAAFDLKNPQLTLCQFSDNQTYVNSITKLNVFDPVEIVVPKTAFENQSMPVLLRQLEEELPSVRVTGIERRYFNEQQGLDTIRTICLPECNAVEMEITSKYYALSAANALIRYIEHVQNVICSNRSIKVIYATGEHTCRIDSGTVRDLELITSLVNPKSQVSLLGVLNHTKTVGGHRLLRTNILQPPFHHTTITVRHDAVEELTRNEELFMSLQMLLPRFLDVEYLLAQCVQIPKQETIRTMEMQIQNAIGLKHTIELIPPLKNIIEKAASNTLLNTYAQYLNDARFEQLHKKICAVLNEDVSYQRGALNRITQKCYAVKPNLNGLLDVTRRTYAEVVDDIVLLVQQLSEEYGRPLNVAYSNVRGYYIQMGRHASADDLPDVFIKVTEGKTTFSFTTADLIKLNDRVTETLNEIYTLSNIVVSNLMREIREEIGCLYKLAEVVSNVDFLLSLAEVCTLGEYVRPEFGTTTCIKNGYHPVLGARSNSEIVVVPNNTYLHKDSNVNIITGPNMSGKSMYLRQVVLLSVMAQIGAFVPAEFAAFRMSSQIFSRTGHRDDISTNLSSFMLEMKQMKYILQNIDDNSLVIIDELGRGTSEEEGAACAFAVAAQFIDSDAFVLFATHFDLLNELEFMYPNVTNYCMETSRNNDGIRLTYKHKLVHGCCDMDVEYGINLAFQAGFPQNVIVKAREISSRIQALKKGSGQRISKRKLALHNIERSLIDIASLTHQLLEGCNLDDATLKNTLIAFQAQAKQLVLQKQSMFECSDEDVEMGHAMRQLDENGEEITPDNASSLQAQDLVAVEYGVEDNQIITSENSDKFKLFTEPPEEVVNVKYYTPAFSKPDYSKNKRTV